MLNCFLVSIQSLTPSNTNYPSIDTVPDEVRRTMWLQVAFGAAAALAAVYVCAVKALDRRRKGQETTGTKLRSGYRQMRLTFRSPRF